jgi:putative FmdB family regulatory protein
MPIYTFRCLKNHESEAIVKADETKVKCPKCLAPAKRTKEYELPARRNPAHGIG